MGRLSTFAKNRILNLRFQKSYRIKQIAATLLQEDNIKVSRKSISTFLKKYIETKSINDKPRSGRNKKLTPEEINLIGEVTRLNRDITAPKIKEYLNLNVSTYTILRASKLFEWNKLNPNSNQAKKAAALERQLNGGEIKKRRSTSSRRKGMSSNGESSGADDSNEIANEPSKHEKQVLLTDLDLKLVSEADIHLAKNVSSSPMVFATKILYKIFDLSELLGHNVSGKTFNKFIKNKKALDEKRINYIRWLVESNFESENREELWKACRTAINKSIRNNEIKGFQAAAKQLQQQQQQQQQQLSHGHLVHLEPNLRIVQITNDIMPESLDEVIEQEKKLQLINEPQISTSVIKLTDEAPFDDEFELKIKPNHENEDDAEEEEEEKEEEEDATDSQFRVEDSVRNLNLLSKEEIIELKSLHCSPMIFSTKVLLKLFGKDELVGHSFSSTNSSKTSQRLAANKQQQHKPALDEARLDYIKWLIETYFRKEKKPIETVWKSCRKAINRVIRNFEIKEAKALRKCDLLNEDENSHQQLDQQDADTDIDESMPMDH